MLSNFAIVATLGVIATLSGAGVMTYTIALLRMQSNYCLTLAGPSILSTGLSLMVIAAMLLPLP